MIFNQNIIVKLLSYILNRLKDGIICTIYCNALIRCLSSDLRSRDDDLIKTITRAISAQRPDGRPASHVSVITA